MPDERREGYADLVDLVHGLKEDVEGYRKDYVDVVTLVARLTESGDERRAQVSELFRLVRDHVATKADIERVLEAGERHVTTDEIRFTQVGGDVAAIMKILRGDEDAEGLAQRIKSLESDRALVRRSLWAVLAAGIGAPAFFAGCIEIWRFMRGH